MWSPTHVQVTVQSARNLRVKGKHGLNDVYVTIQLGSEKYQTSVQEKCSVPEWHEECELTIPDGNTSAIVLNAFHRNLIGLDKFLGQVEILLRDLDIYERAKNKWYPLFGKKNKHDFKNRGELELRIAFVVKSASGSLVDLTKKQKKGGSLPLKMVNKLGGSLMSLSGKEKKFSVNNLRDSLGKFSDKLPRKRSYRKSDTFADSPQIVVHEEQFDPDGYSDSENLSISSSFSGDHEQHVPASQNTSAIHSKSSTFYDLTDLEPNSYSSPNALATILNTAEVNRNIRDVEPRKTDDSSPAVRWNYSARSSINTNRTKPDNHDHCVTHNGSRFYDNNNVNSSLKSPAVECLSNEEQSSRSRTTARTSVPRELLALYNTMTKQELIDMLCKQHKTLERQHSQIQDLESYIDDLLVRVMDTTPRILQNPYQRSSSFM